jgi:hypothetical protein
MNLPGHALATHKSTAMPTKLGGDVYLFEFSIYQTISQGEIDSP